MNPRLAQRAANDRIVNGLLVPHRLCWLPS